MCNKYSEYLKGCMYFTVNSLSRFINKMAEDEFMVVRLSPSHAVMMMLINENPGISQQEISCAMNLAPSTVTRFIDKLISKKLITRTVNGVSREIEPTESGKALDEKIHQCWANLYHRYCDILGEELAVKMTEDMHKANLEFSDK